MPYSPYGQMPPWVRPTFDSELQDEEVAPAPPPMPQRKPMAMPPPRQPQMADAPPDFYRVTGEPVGSGMPAMPQGAAQPMPDAPPPMPKRLTAAEQMDQMGPRPVLKPQSLGRGLLGAGIDAATAIFMPAMLPFVHREVANRIAYGKDQLGSLRDYDAKHQFLKEQSALEDKALQRQIQLEGLQGNREYRAGMTADREADNARAEQQMIAGLGQEVQPGEQIDTQRNLYRDYKGKKYKKPTEFANKEADQQAKQADWVTVTPEMEQEYGRFGFKAGAKVDPARVTQLIGFEEANGRAREANALKQILADQSNQTRQMIAGMANNLGQQRIDLQRDKSEKPKPLNQRDQGFVDATNALEKSIDELLSEYKTKRDIEGVGPVAGSLGRKVSAVTGVGTDAARQNRAKLGNIAAGILHEKYGSALSKGENERAATFVPNVTDAPADVAVKLQQLKEFNANKRDEILKRSGANNSAPVEPKPTQYNGKPAYKMTKGGRTVYIDAAKADQAQRDGWTFEVSQ